MREIAFLIAGFSEDNSRELRRRRPSQSRARLAAWALVGIALLYWLGGAKPGQLEITSPSSGTATPNAQILVIGKAIGIQGDVTLEVNGSPQSVPVKDGLFEALVSLVLGDNFIRVLATGYSPPAINVVRLKTSIAITSPPDSYTTDQETAVVRGTVANSSAAAITLIVNESRRIVTVQNGGFACDDVALRVGENRIRAVIDDEASNEIVVTRTLPPVIITLTSPPSGSTQVPIAQVRGTIQNARTNSVTVLVNRYEQVVPVRDEGFALDVPLKIGDNAIRVVQGEDSSPEVVVNLEPPPPVVIEIRSQQGRSIQETRIIGTIENSKGPTVTLSINGIPRTTARITNKSFASYVDLAFGYNHIRGSQGEAVSNELVVNRPQPILIEITEPRSSSIQASSGRSSVKVRGTIAHQRSDTITLTVNGVASDLEIKNERFETDVNLSIGRNRIQASQDGTFSKEVLVYLSKPKPRIEIVSPRSDQTQSSYVTVTGTIKDPASQTVTLTVNGIERGKATVNNDAFVGKVDLDFGENRIRASQDGSSSNEVIMVRPRKFTIETPKVMIFIDTPKEGHITEQRSQVVRGRVENGEAKGITVNSNGISHRVRTGPREFESTVTLRPGKNLIRASLGNAYAEVTVTLEVKQAQPDKTPDKTPNKSPDKAPDKPPDKTPPDKAPDRMPDKTPNKAPDKTPDKAPDKTPDKAPDRMPDKPVDPCRRVNCDCENVKATLSMIGTAPAGSAAVNIQTFSFSASITGSQSRRPPRDRRVQCLEAEDELKKYCGATGKVEGFCPAKVSGPKAWPKPAETKKAGSGGLRKVLEKEKQGVKKP